MAYGLECGHRGDGRRFQITGCASPVAARLSRAGRGFSRSWDCPQSGETATLRSAGTVVSRQVSRSRPGGGEFRKSVTSTRTPFLHERFSAYELSYCEGREREAYDRLRTLYQRGEKEHLPRLLNQLRVMEERLKIPANERIIP